MARSRNLVPIRLKIPVLKLPLNLSLNPALNPTLNPKCLLNCPPAEEGPRQGALRQLHLPPAIRPLRLGTPQRRAVGPRQGPEQAADQGGIPIH